MKIRRGDESVAPYRVSAITTGIWWRGWLIAQGCTISGLLMVTGALVNHDEGAPKFVFPLALGISAALINWPVAAWSLWRTRGRRTAVVVADMAARSILVPIVQWIALATYFDVTSDMGIGFEGWAGGAYLVAMVWFFTGTPLWIALLTRWVVPFLPEFRPPPQGIDEDAEDIETGMSFG